MKYLPHDVFSENYGQYDDKESIDIYSKMLHETDAAKRRALMRAFEKRVLDTEAHEMVGDLLEPHRSVALLREGLENQPKPLPQPGPGQRRA